MTPAIGWLITLVGLPAAFIVGMLAMPNNGMFEYLTKRREFQHKERMAEIDAQLKTIGIQMERAP